MAYIIYIAIQGVKMLSAWFFTWECPAYFVCGNFLLIKDVSQFRPGNHGSTGGPKDYCQVSPSPNRYTKFQSCGVVFVRVFWGQWHQSPKNWFVGILFFSTHLNINLFLETAHVYVFQLGMRWNSSKCTSGKVKKRELFCEYHKLGIGSLLTDVDFMYFDSICSGLYLYTSICFKPKTCRVCFPEMMQDEWAM